MQRFSKNRAAILDCLRSTDTHPTAEWIYDRLKPSYPQLSLGTVYRNLCQMKKDGMILSVGVVAGEEHFDADISLHAHVLCTGCGKIADLAISDEMIQAVRQAESTGYQIHSPQFSGRCPECISVSRSMERSVNHGSEIDV